MDKRLQLTVLTGGSRGLGLAMARQLLEQGHRLLVVSRQAPALPAADGMLEHLPVDLTGAMQAYEPVRAWLQAHAGEPWEGVNLINNAGMLPTLSALCEVPPAELQAALRVGLEAATLLSAAFLVATKGWAMPRKLLMISSGVGRRPLTGAGVYSVAKAGLDCLALVLSAEQALQPGGARVVSLAPGTFETDMQVQLRGARPDTFAHSSRFVDLHQQGLVESPETAAAKVLAYLARPDFGQHPVADVREEKGPGGPPFVLDARD